MIYLDFYKASIEAAFIPTLAIADFWSEVYFLQFFLPSLK